MNIMKNAFITLAVLCVLLTAPAFGQTVFHFNIAPISFTASVDKHASPSVVQLSTPIVLNLIDNTSGLHLFRVDAPSVTDVNGQYSNTMFGFVFFDGNSTYAGNVSY